jgi:hypothetical protein
METSCDESSIQLLGIYPILILTITAVAWVYPEHRDIAWLALERLEPAKRLVLDKLWSEARVGHEDRLCARIAEPPQGANPTWIMHPALPFREITPVQQVTRSALCLTAWGF